MKNEPSNTAIQKKLDALLPKTDVESVGLNDFMKKLSDEMGGADLMPRKDFIWKKFLAECATRSKSASATNKKKAPKKPPSNSEIQEKLDEIIPAMDVEAVGLTDLIKNLSDEMGGADLMQRKDYIWKALLEECVRRSKSTSQTFMKDKKSSKAIQEKLDALLPETDVESVGLTDFMKTLSDEMDGTDLMPHKDFIWKSFLAECVKRSKSTSRTNMKKAPQNAPSTTEIQNKLDEILPEMDVEAVGLTDLIKNLSDEMGEWVDLMSRKDYIWKALLEECVRRSKSTSLTFVKDKKLMKVLQKKIDALLPETDVESVGLTDVMKTLSDEMDGADLKPHKDFIWKCFLAECVKRSKSTSQDDGNDDENDGNEDAQGGDDNEGDDDGDDDDGDVKDGERRNKRDARTTKGHGNGGGLNEPKKISDELAELLGKGKRMARTDVVKYIWEYIREHDLQNPDNKQEIILDDAMKKVFGVDQFDMFALNKYISAHIEPFQPVEEPSKRAQEKKRGQASKEKPNSSSQPPNKKSRKTGDQGGDQEEDEGDDEEVHDKNEDDDLDDDFEDDAEEYGELGNDDE